MNSRRMGPACSSEDRKYSAINRGSVVGSSGQIFGAALIDKYGINQKVRESTKTEAKD